jgi:uncharacterized protein (TIGR02466 family)
VTSKTCGVVYVASGADHDIEAAFLSAESIRRFCPDLPISLFGGSRSHSLCRTEFFDDVAPSPGAGLADCLAASPYEFTLYLANDTRLFTPHLRGVFAWLEDADVAMVEAAPDVSTLRRHLGKPVFDTGFILYRRTQNVAAWLSAWRDLTQRNHALSRQSPVSTTDLLMCVPDAESRRQLLLLDQTSLAEIMTAESNRFGLKVEVLPYDWNHTDSGIPAYSMAPRKLRHSPVFLPTTRADIIALAYAWTQAGRTSESEGLYDYVASREKQPGPFDTPLRSNEKPEVWRTHALRNADLHLRQGQPKISGALFTAISESDDAFPYALVGRARIALQEGQIEAAANLVARALKRIPDSPYALTIEGIALLAAQRIQDAVTPLGLAAQAGVVTAAFHLGNAHRQLGNPALAAEAYRRTLELDPEHRDAHANLIAVLLRSRQYDEAAATADGLLIKQPWHVSALSQKYIALRETGRDAAAQTLADFDRFVVCEQIEVPAGFASLADFNQALGRALRADPSLERDPTAHATRGGWHTGDLALNKTPEIKALNALVQHVATRRINDAPADDHPFEIARPLVFRLNSWAIIMEEGGHQIPHIHSSGWLSGVYYVDVPPEIRADDPERHGWLAFGRGDPRWHRETSAIERRFVCPVPGLLVTFPSFFWHETLPLHTTKPRISFAFDINPAMPWQPS